jgi:hypothetical protein
MPAWAVCCVRAGTRGRVDLVSPRSLRSPIPENTSIIDSQSHRTSCLFQCFFCTRCASRRVRVVPAAFGLHLTESPTSVSTISLTPPLPRILTGNVFSAPINFPVYLDKKSINMGIEVCPKPSSAHRHLQSSPCAPLQRPRRFCYPQEHRLSSMPMRTTRALQFPMIDSLHQ